jgi:hypothetical protein
MEAIGLGLGVVPLMIEFLKAKPGPVFAMQAIKSENGKEMMEDFYNALRFELKMLRITLSDLVEDLQIGEDVKTKLLSKDCIDPEVWKAPSEELQICLRRRLDPCSEDFTKALDKILTLLSKFVKDGTLPGDVPVDANVSAAIMTRLSDANLRSGFAPIPNTQN